MSGYGTAGLIYQDEVWVDGQKRIHKVEAMEIRHAQNVYRYLLEGDRPLMLLDSVLNSILGGPAPNGEMAQDALDSETERLMQMRDKPREWLKQQPLLVALQARGWGQPEPKAKPRQRELLVLVRVKLAPDADSIPVQFDIEEALERLGYDLEVTDFKDMGRG